MCCQCGNKARLALSAVVGAQVRVPGGSVANQINKILRITISDKGADCVRGRLLSNRKSLLSKDHPFAQNFSVHRYSNVLNAPALVSDIVSNSE